MHLCRWWRKYSNVIVNRVNPIAAKTERGKEGDLTEQMSQAILDCVGVVTEDYRDLGHSRVRIQELEIKVNTLAAFEMGVE